MREGGGNSIYKDHAAAIKNKLIDIGFAGGLQRIGNFVFGRFSRLTRTKDIGCVLRGSSLANQLVPKVYPHILVNKSSTAVF
jgi:hypothetical protein